MLLRPGGLFPNRRRSLELKQAPLTEVQSSEEAAAAEDAAGGSEA
jgi:hypothetical protein